MPSLKQFLEEINVGDEVDRSNGLGYQHEYPLKIINIILGPIQMLFILNMF